MKDLKEVQKIIRGSKQFTFEGTVLVVIDYYTGEKVRLDLGELTEETLEELQVEDEEEEW